MTEEERKKNRQWQVEGIEVARADGVIFGRPKHEIDGKFVETYREWKAGQITATEAMRRIVMKKLTFYRRVKEYEEIGSSSCHPFTGGLYGVVPAKLTQSRCN